MSLVAIIYLGSPGIMECLSIRSVLSALDNTCTRPRVLLITKADCTLCMENLFLFFYFSMENLFCCLLNNKIIKLWSTSNKWPSNIKF